MSDTTIPGATPELHIDGALATVTLRRPAVGNRMELEDLDTVLEQVARVNADLAVRVLCLRSGGRQFCSGFNVNQVGGAGGTAGERFEALADALENARPLTVAVLQGGAYGGAVDLVQACDFRIGSAGITLRVPAVALGLHFYRGGLERMVTRLGLPVARRLMLAAESFDAASALAAGLLDRVVAPEALVQDADAFCQHLAGLAPLAVLPMKRHMNAIARGRLDIEALAADIERALASDDLQEGGRAWAEKRTPRFVGR
jgi:enoyl-CoA hydratase